MQLSPIIAFWWPFVSGWMLIWAAAAAIPIIIHLWSRRRYREVTWAAMEYLLAAMRKNARRIRIEQLILLAVRTLILLLLAIALADPFLSLFSSLGTTFGNRGQTHWVLVLDGSYSMDFKPADKTRFDTAKDLATQLVQQAAQGDGFTLILMSDPPRVIVPEPAFDADDISEEIKNLQLPHGGGNLAATLSEVESILQTAQEKHQRLVNHKVSIFTDLQRTTWDEVTTPDCLARVGRLAERASLVLFDLGEPGGQNLAVTGLDVRESLVTVARDLKFQAALKNFGSEDRRQQSLEFYVDGRRVQEVTVEVPAQGEASASFAHRFETPGEHSVEVRLAGDPLAVDNYRWLSVPVRESIRVLVVRGSADAARHVALALQPAKSDRPLVRPETAPESALLELDLNNYDCIFLCNVGRFGRDEGAVLHNYLKNGGGLVFFLGDRVQAESYNLELGGELSKRRVVPAQIGEVVSEAQYSFDPLEYRHPLVALFAGHPQSGLLTTPVWKYMKLTPYDSMTSKVALAFDGGDPAIVEEPILRGRSILVATAASSEPSGGATGQAAPWNAWASWPSFPPLVQEMLALAVSGRSEGRNLQVGEDIVGSVHSTVANLSLNVVAPDGRGERVRMTVDGEDSRWAYSGTAQSGLYEARYGPPLSNSQLFGLNVNTRESDLDRFDADLLPSQFNQDFKVNNQSTPTLPSPQRSELFRLFLGLVLVLLFVETFLAWRFGNASA